MSTFNTRMTRGQTKVLTMTVRDTLNRLADLTSSKVYFAMRADIKILPTLKLTSDAALVGMDATWRLGIAVADQTGALKGQFTVTLIPADTAGMVALGDDDPWLYDAWIVDATLGTIPVVDQSTIGLYPQVTTLP